MTSDAKTSRVENGDGSAASPVLFARFLLSRVCPAARRERTRPHMQMRASTMRLDSAAYLYARYPVHHFPARLFIPAGERATLSFHAKNGKRRIDREREGGRGGAWKDSHRQARSIDLARRDRYASPSPRRAWKQAELRFVITASGR